MTVVSNTSPVVLLAKIKRLRLLKELYGEVLLSPAVKVESVDKGRELGARDVGEIERGMKEGWIRLVKLNRSQSRQAGSLVREARIGQGEGEALVLAKDKKTVAILDDKEARAIAEGWKISHTSTLMVIYGAYVKGLISYDELIDDLNKLTKVMWISTDVVTEIIRRAKGVKR
jgi:hypothetical protein